MAYTSKERVCLNADKSAVVDCESEEAAYVLVGEGGTISDEEARQYGLAGRRKQAEDDADAVPSEAADAEEKARQPADNKARTAAPENKAR
jgi:hypothetical protein